MKEVLNTIEERLEYMQDVALFKANNHLPVEDVDREKKVIKPALRTANAINLSAEGLEHFFTTQISVAKAIQYRYRAHWLSVPANKIARDYKLIFALS